MKADALRDEVKRLVSRRTDARLGIDNSHTYQDELLKWWNSLCKDFPYMIDDYGQATMALTVFNDILDQHPLWNHETVVMAAQLEMGMVST